MVEINSFALIFLDVGADKALKEIVSLRQTVTSLGRGSVSIGTNTME